jgi:hypothetical protein
MSAFTPISFGYGSMVPLPMHSTSVSCELDMLSLVRDTFFRDKLVITWAHVYKIIHEKDGFHDGLKIFSDSIANLIRDTLVEFTPEYLVRFIKCFTRDKFTGESCIINFLLIAINTFVFGGIIGAWVGHTESKDFIESMMNINGNTFAIGFNPKNPCNLCVYLSSSILDADGSLIENSFCVEPIIVNPDFTVGLKGKSYTSLSHILLDVELGSPFRTCDFCYFHGNISFKTSFDRMKDRLNGSYLFRYSQSIIDSIIVVTVAGETVNQSQLFTIIDGDIRYIIEKGKPETKFRTLDEFITIHSTRYLKHPVLCHY